MTIERYLGCAESAVLLLGKPIRLQFSDISRVIYCNATCVRTSECMSMSVATVAKCVPRIQQSFCSTQISTVINDAVQSLGFKEIRKDQFDVISKFLEGYDVFVSLPTGGGKSLCFASLPLVFDLLRGSVRTSIAVIISPLNALMQDQVSKFTHRGMSAVYVGSECSSTVANNVINGKVQLIYMSPESVLTVPTWREMFRNRHFKENLICLAVDEAHLIEKWCVFVCVCVCVWA